MFRENDSYDGRIIKGIAGFYYVYVENEGVVECHAKGIFRKDNTRPLVGDRVRISITDAGRPEGVLSEVYPRSSSLVRPEVANVDQVLILFAYSQPKPNLDLLDKFLISVGLQNVPAIICFNKKDLVEEVEQQRIHKVYENCGAKVLSICAASGTNMKELHYLLEKKITALAGPSGVGKSTLTNVLCPEASMETGDISRKLARGKHTTRHAELLYVGPETYLMDTPGFSALLLDGLAEDELKDYYPEFYSYEEKCRYQPCSHIHEPDCGVLKAVDDGMISAERYESYRRIYNELKNRKKY